MNKEHLKEHKNFRNQMIFTTILLNSIGIYFNIDDLVAFGIIFGFIALWNIITYYFNKKEYGQKQN